VKKPQRSLLSPRMALAGNRNRPPSHHQRPSDLLRPKPASVRPQHQFSPSKINPFHPFLIVFDLPNELILSVLSHISPELKLAGHYARFRVEYVMQINDDHQRRVRFLRPLSMTCKAMRVRVLPWIWERLEPSWKIDSTDLNVIANASHTDTSLAASVEYSCLLLCLCVGAESCSLKVHDSASPVVQRHPRVRRMPSIPPESLLARDRAM